MTDWFTEKYGTNLKTAIISLSSVLLRRFRTTEVQNHPHKKDKAGHPLIYLDTSAAIDRLNEAFTPLGWSYVIGDPVYSPLPVGADFPHVPASVAVKGRITILLPWGNVTKEQWGSSVLKSLWDRDASTFGTKKAYSQQSAEFGDDLKSASSDALKKCATLLGVFNYQSRKGTNVVEEDAAPILTELMKIATEVGWVTPGGAVDRIRLLTFCGGVTGKTINTAADLSAVQASACLNILRTLKRDAPDQLAALSP